MEELRLPRLFRGREPACQCRRCRRGWCDSWMGTIPWRRKWQPTLVFLPGKSQGQKTLAGYSPRGLRESDRTEKQNMHAV